jgi:hypothetical protein
VDLRTRPAVAVPEPRHDNRGARLTRWAPPAAIGGMAVSGAALFAVPLRHVGLERMDAFGLISVLPLASLAGLGLLTLAFVLALGLRRARPLLLGGILVAIVLCLHGVTSVIESQPRFATSYQIAGFAEFIGRTGHTEPTLNAYFSWPGFFAVVAFVQKVTGGHSLLGVLQFWPVLINLAYLVSVWLILRNLRASWRARWLAALLFTVGLWVGQDYFSPQSFDYLLYLLFVAFALTWFRARPGARRPAVAGRSADADGQAGWVARHASWAGRYSRWASRCSGWAGRYSRWASRCPGWAGRYSRWASRCPGWTSRGLRVLTARLVGGLGPGELPARQASKAERAVLLAVLLGIFAAITVSHQLTPILVLAALGGLVLARRSTLTGLPVLLAVIVICWLSFAATGYWSGHLSDIFGSVGHLGGNVSAGVGGRLAGASRGHELVLYLRVGFAIAMLGLAAAGLLRRRRWGIDDRVALVLTCVPFISLGLQSYGGEILLRVYLFALPAASVLAAYLFFPRADPGLQAAPAGGPVGGSAGAAAVGRASARPPGSKDARAGRAVHPAPPARRSWPALVAAAVITVAMTGGFLVARYGNEAFEQTPRGELAATDYLYAHDRGGVRVLWLSQRPPLDVTPEMPWQYRDIEKVRYSSSQAPANPAAVGGVIAALRAAGPHSYVITTTTQEAYLEQVASYRSGWGQVFRAHMTAAPGVRTVFANHDAAIYALHWPRGAVVRPLRIIPGGHTVWATSWTPVGLVVAGLLLLVLLAREFIRVSGTAAVRLIRPLTLVSLPLIILLLAVVVERFVVLS